MLLSRLQIENCLKALAEKMEAEGRPQIRLLVCGGSALQLSGLIVRTTEDVDVLGVASPEHDLKPMPEWLEQCADELARDHGLEKGWLNDAASLLLGVGLPDGILARSTKLTFGLCLTAAIASRMDLVALKCLAALDGRTGRKHFEDLTVICPTSEELAFAKEWLLARPTSPDFRQAVDILLKTLKPSD